MSEWVNPDEFFLTLRCTEAKYADSFLEKGAIKFNTPQSWVNREIELGEGRGDKFEGTIAIYNEYDIENMKLINEKYNKYSEIERVGYDGKIYLKNSRSMNLPCYCFYIMKNSLFKCPEEDGRINLKSMIEGIYFRDFTDNMTVEQVEALDDIDKPALIVIKNFDAFKSRIVKALLEIGVKEHEIIISQVSYYNFNINGKYGWWDFGQKFPNELTIKDTRFKEQSEARIIINTDNIKIKEYLKDNVLEIGPMKDIAEVIKEYFYDGIDVEINADIRNQQ